MMRVNKQLMGAALGALLLPLAGLASSSTAEQLYEQGHAALNEAWDMEAQSVRMGYSANAKLKYQQRAADSYHAALANFEQAIAADPDNYQAHSIRGLVLRKLGRHQEALDAYGNALAVNEEDLATVEYRAEAYVELGRFDDAKAAYFELVKQNTHLSQDLLAFMQMWLNRPDPAQQQLLGTQEYQNLVAWLEERTGISQTLAMSEASADQNW